MTESTLKTFHLFPHLPFELRNTIWTQAITSTSQILTYNFNVYVQEFPGAPEDVIHFHSPSLPLPSLLQINHESRLLALAIYAPSYHLRENRILNPNQPRETPCPIATHLAAQNAHRYWNPLRDLVLLQPRQPGELPWPQNCGVWDVCRNSHADFRPTFDERTRFLVLDYERVKNVPSWWGTGVYLLNWIDGMKELEVIFLKIEGEEFRALSEGLEDLGEGNDGELERSKRGKIEGFKRRVREEWEVFMMCVNQFMETKEPRPKPVALVVVENDEEILRMMDEGRIS